MGKSFGSNLKRGLAAVILLAVLLPVFSAFASETVNLSNRIAWCYNNTNGLPSSEANAICQTEAGYIWIGSYAGLVRYDGNRFQNLSETAGIPASIRCLFETDDGTLWIGTNNDGVYRYSKDTFAPVCLSDGSALPSVRCFAQTPDGTLYVGTTNGLYRMTEDGFIFLPQDELHNAVDYLAVDANGALWGCGSQSAIFVYKDDQILNYWTKEDFFTTEYKMLSCVGNSIFVGTFSNNVLELELMDESYASESIVVKVYSTGDLATINTIYEDVRGNIWIGADNGTGFFDQNRVFYTDEELINCIGVSQIIQDYEGNYWISSSKQGVYQISHGRFYHAGETVGRSINATTINSQALFLGTDTGLITLDGSRKRINVQGLEELHDVRIRDVMTDSNGLVWICTYSDLGLYCYDTASGVVTTYTESEGLLNSWTRKTVELSDGTIAVLTYQGINLIRDGKVLDTQFGAEEGIKALPVLCLVETQSGEIFAGTDGDGLYCLGLDGTLQKKTDGVLDGLSVVLAMAADPEDGIWFSSGDHLYYMGSDGEARILPDFTNGVGSVFDIIFAGEDVILTKSEGIYILNRQEMLEGKAVSAEVFGIKEGLQGSMNANSRSILSNGHLFLASSGGMNVFSLEEDGSTMIAPKVYLNEILVQDEKGERSFSYVPEDGTQVIEIPSDTRRLIIRFACLSFSGKQATVQYNLSPFDQEPSIVLAGEETSATYTNLPGGEYVFTLKATNVSGVESETPVQLLIHKEYTLWERAWVKVLAVLAALLVIFLIFWLKTRSIRKEQERYREITHQSLQTIANTIDAKDSYTKGHSMRVATYARELAKRLGLSEREQEDIYFIALLHDIGKIGTPDAILNKPGKLTEEEFAVIRRHTVDGASILSQFTIIPHIWKGARWHHERIDGKGYPDGKAADDIPYLARIICVADAFDAMSTNRPYRNALDMENIVQELENCKGTQFEPEIVDQMVKYIRDQEKELSDDER